MISSGQLPLPMADSLVLRGPSRPEWLRDRCLADLLSATAHRHPDHPALECGGRVVSYRELDQLSHQLGAALAERGITRGKVAGLFLPSGADALIAQAGITKSGAAWLPLDPHTPLDRVRTCLQAAGAGALVTCREWLPRLANLSVPVWAVEDLLSAPAGAVSPVAAQPSDPAYIIYTSGSTGQPKGIAISHRSICHFLRAENEVLGVAANDRVYQGFSLAFDMSFEEIWIAYLVGATLWIAPPGVAPDPAGLAEVLRAHRITVLHAVPTLMSLVPDPLPSLRVINLGGEACPEALARRLAQPGRRVFNTYGPTETTVSASVAELKPDQPVTIGRPLPNYGMLVIDEQGQPLPPGRTGELCVFGPGLALGYVGRDDLTAERFVLNPLAEGPGEERMYRTGDLGRIEPGGPVHCLGRTDRQVKVRGFRIELDEIAVVLAGQPGVAAAAVIVKAIEGVDQVLAFVMPGPGPALSVPELRKSLRERLPHYMVPGVFQVVRGLPRLASGKIDLAAVRDLPLTPTESAPANVAHTPEEKSLQAALQKLFPGAELAPRADFFSDLGGHSLLAARLVSLLRAEPAYACLSVQDIYRERELGRIARVMERLRLANRTAPPAAARAPTPLRQRFLCGMVQAATLPCFILLNIAGWLAPFFVYHYYTGDPDSRVARAVLYALAAFVIAELAKFPTAIVGKRWLAGRLQPGRYPLWGFTYFRWWLGSRFCEVPDLYLIASTAWMPLYLRALGARIGRDVMIDRVTVAVPELLTLETGVSLGTFVNIENARVEGGELIIGPVHLKDGAVVESYAVLENGTTLGAGSWLAGQSALAAGQRIPDGQTWVGAPARPGPVAREPVPPRPVAGPIRRTAWAVLLALTAIAVMVLFFIPVFPAFMLIDWIDLHTLDVFESDLQPILALGFFFVLAIPASALLVAATVVLAGVLRWLLPRQKPGIFSVYSFAFWRKKFTSLVLDSSLQLLHGLYASVYAPAWLRLLGVRVGRNTEVSTAEGLSPELLILGEGCFIADGAMVGDEELRNGWMVLKPVQVGNRSFIGNGAYVPDGAILPDDVLIAVQTRAPANAELKPGQTWIGCPPQLLPARERSAMFPAWLTFEPTPLRRGARGLIEALRIVLPLAMVIAFGYLIVAMVMPLASEEGWGLEVALALAVAGCCYALASFLLVVACKWIFIGRYRPRAAPMWTLFVWVSEAVTSIYESLAVPNLLASLEGTPMLPWALRLLGAHIGKGVWLNTTDLTEFDCVSIGDEAELNVLSGPQTHLFEDRVMKIGLVNIGARCSVGARSTILYDAEMGDGARLGPLTLVTKGERLPPDSQWQGSPATPVT